MRAPPKWAQELTLNALLWWEEQCESAPNFELRWRRGKRYDKRYESSGRAGIFKDKFVLVTAGTNRIDAKLVLLHEIAHQLTNDFHTAHFWDVAWQLYRWAKLPMRYCIKREQDYRKGAMIAYKRIGK